jgi:hypothetical protein
MTFLTHVFAAELASRLTEIVPPRFRVEARRDWVTVSDGGALPSSVSTMPIAWNPDRPLEQMMASVAQNVLNNVQDYISIATREPWPPVDGAPSAMEPYFAYWDGPHLMMGYGPKHEPVVALRPMATPAFDRLDDPDSGTDVPTPLRPLLVVLCSQREPPAISHIAYFFSMTCRDLYIESGREATASLRSFRCANEILHVLAQQAIAHLDLAEIGYPPDALIDVLMELAEQGGLESRLIAAATLALASTARYPLVRQSDSST